MFHWVKSHQADCKPFCPDFPTLQWRNKRTHFIKVFPLAATTFKFYSLNLFYLCTCNFPRTPPIAPSQGYPNLYFEERVLVNKRVESFEVCNVSVGAVCRRCVPCDYRWTPDPGHSLLQRLRDCTRIVWLTQTGTKCFFWRAGSKDKFAFDNH